MTATDQPVYFTKIPIVGCPGMECVIPVDDAGRACDDDGEPMPLEDRPNTCGKDGIWMIGAAFVCAEHWPETCRLGGWDHEEIERDWREAVR